VDILVFQLSGPLASWGEPAVGEYRGSADHPSLSAIFGLIGAALGLQRDDEAAHAALRDGYACGIGVASGGSLLRDYHTVQMPTRSGLKGHPHVTRRDELAVSPRNLHTIQSTRDHRQNGHWRVALAVRDGLTPRWPLASLALALQRPAYVLYLGRKACVPDLPLWPRLVQADDARTAFEAYAQAYRERVQSVGLDHWRHDMPAALPGCHRIHVDDHLPAGAPITLSVQRKDRLIHRGAWQFGDRSEHLAVLTEET
jgi:CRISPR system Cascade subunit CasD